MLPDKQVKIQPNWAGTIGILVGCLFGYYLSFDDLPSSIMLRHVSISLLAGIIFSFIMDWRFGLRNLVRVDVFALLAFYFLTFFEFLFPQSRFDLLAIPDDVLTATHLALLGLAAMTLGRHLNVLPRKQLDKLGDIQMEPKHFLLIFFGAFILNFLPMFLAVDFNPVDWFHETLQPRFSRPWSRGRLGDLSSLLNELQLLGYVLPPIAGLIFARWRSYAKFTLVIIALCLLLLWYTAFSSGTRNILAIQVASFFAGFFVVQKKISLKILLPTAAAVGIVFIILANMMLDFRRIGLDQYIREGRYTAEFKEYKQQYMAERNMKDEAGYFVDYNLWRLSQIVSLFPEVYGYIGWNMPFVAITKPIPRALWPEKPEGLAVSLEEAIGAEGYTIAVTWVGEAYVAGGGIWIIAIGLLIGAFCYFWNELAKFIQNPFPLIVFASGFYAVLLLMRSLMFFTTALLPSIALIVLGVFMYKQNQKV